MKRSILILLKFCIFLATVTAIPTLSAQAQTLRVRVLKINDRHPLPHQDVSVALLYEKGEKPPPKYDANLRSTTDENGEAQFLLPEPAPVHLAVQLHLTSEHWHCGCMILAATQELIQRGLVQTPGPQSKESSTNANPEPGLILFFVRPFTFFERLLYPLLKE